MRPAAAAAGLPLGLLFLARLIDGASGGTAATAGTLAAVRHEHPDQLAGQTTANARRFFRIPAP